MGNEWEGGSVDAAQYATAAHQHRIVYQQYYRYWYWFVCLIDRCLSLWCVVLCVCVSDMAVENSRRLFLVVMLHFAVVPRWCVQCVRNECFICVFVCVLLSCWLQFVAAWHCIHNNWTYSDGTLCIDEVKPTSRKKHISCGSITHCDAFLYVNGEWKW